MKQSPNMALKNGCKFRCAPFASFNSALTAMNLDQAFEELRNRNEEVPIPSKPPKDSDVAVMEKQLGVVFHPDYRRFLKEASHIVYGPIEPATIMEPDSHTYLPKVVSSAKAYGVPNDLFPFCEDNADFYCLDATGAVIYWSHNGWDATRYQNLADWIEDVWLYDYS